MQSETLPDLFPIPLHRPDQHDGLFVPTVYLTKFHDWNTVVAAPAVVVVRHHEGGHVWQGAVLLQCLVRVVADDAGAVDDEGPAFVSLVIRPGKGFHLLWNAADEGHVFVREIVPAAGEVVDGVSVGRDGNFVRPRVFRTECALGIDGDTVETLDAVFGLEAFFDQQLRRRDGVDGEVELSLRVAKHAMLVFVEQFTDDGIARFARDEPRADTAAAFEAKERGLAEQVVKAPQGFDVAVEVDAAFVVERIEPDVVADEGVLPYRVGLPDIIIRRNGRACAVPEPDVVVGHGAPPRCDALLDDGRVRTAAQPTVVDDLRNAHAMRSSLPAMFVG